MTTVVNDVSDVGIYNIVADQGTTFIRSITYKDTNGVAINLGTGATAAMKVRKYYPATLKVAAYADSPVLSLSSGSGLSVTAATGVINISIPADTMSAAAPGVYDYDLEVTLGTSPGVGTAGDVIKVIRGLFEIRPEMTY